MSVDFRKKKSELEPPAPEIIDAKVSVLSSKSSNPTKGKSAPVYDTYQGSSPSLKIINVDKSAEVAEIIVEEPKTEFIIDNEIFTQELLLEFWKSFAQQIESEMPRLHQVIISHQPVKLSNDTIQLLLENTSQHKDFMEKIHSRIVAFLKSELKLSKLELVVEISVDNLEQQLIYTAGDKYNFLAEQNTMLHDLKKNFNLDFE